MINVMLVAEDTGEETVYGEVGPEDAWWSVPLPPCPACDGKVEWAEAGQVPGTRRCAECKRYYRLRTIGKFEPSDRYGNEVVTPEERHNDLDTYAVRECIVCTSLIANDPRYGRKASETDSNVCEVCEKEL